MDVLDTEPGDARRRLPRPSTAVVAAGLALLAVAQGVAVARPPLPADVEVGVPLENYFFVREAARAAVQFELENRGPRTVRVLAVDADVPGLRLRDVVAAGEPVGFRSAGAGEDALPAFVLAPRGRVVLTLVFTATACRDVPERARPVRLRVASGRATGTVEVTPPDLPDDRPDAAADDDAAWQVALVRDLCG